MSRGDSAIISSSFQAGHNPNQVKVDLTRKEKNRSRSLSENTRSTKSTFSETNQRAKSYGPDYRKTFSSDDPCVCGPNLYGNVLGPTVDEPILLGLTTFLKICDECPERDNIVKEKYKSSYGTQGTVQSDSYSITGSGLTSTSRDLSYSTVGTITEGSASEYMNSDSRSTQSRSSPTGSNISEESTNSPSRSSQSGSSRTFSSISKEVSISSTTTKGTQSSDLTALKMEPDYSSIVSGEQTQSNHPELGRLRMRSISTEVRSGSSDSTGSRSVSFSAEVVGESTKSALAYQSTKDGKISDDESTIATKSTRHSTSLPKGSTKDDISTSESVVLLPQCLTTLQDTSTPTVSHHTDTSIDGINEITPRIISDSTQTPSVKNEIEVHVVEYTQVPSLTSTYKEPLEPDPYNKIVHHSTYHEPSKNSNPHEPLYDSTHHETNLHGTSYHDKPLHSSSHDPHQATSSSIHQYDPHGPSHSQIKSSHHETVQHHSTHQERSHHNSSHNHSGITQPSFYETAYNLSTHVEPSHHDASNHTEPSHQETSHHFNPSHHSTQIEPSDHDKPSHHSAYHNSLHHPISHHSTTTEEPRKSFLEDYNFHPTISRKGLKRQGCSGRISCTCCLCNGERCGHNHHKDALLLSGFTQTDHESNERFLQKVELDHLSHDSSHEKHKLYNSHHLPSHHGSIHSKVSHIKSHHEHKINQDHHSPSHHGSIHSKASHHKSQHSDHHHSHHKDHHDGSRHLKQSKQPHQTTSHHSHHEDLKTSHPKPHHEHEGNQDHHSPSHHGSIHSKASHYKPHHFDHHHSSSHHKEDHHKGSTHLKQPKQPHQITSHHKSRCKCKTGHSSCHCCSCKSDESRSVSHSPSEHNKTSDHAASRHGQHKLSGHHSVSHFDDRGHHHLPGHHSPTHHSEHHTSSYHDRHYKKSHSRSHHELPGHHPTYSSSKNISEGKDCFTGGKHPQCDCCMCKEIYDKKVAEHNARHSDNLPVSYHSHPHPSREIGHSEQLIHASHYSPHHYAAAHQPTSHYETHQSQHHRPNIQGKAQSGDIHHQHNLSHHQPHGHVSHHGDIHHHSTHNPKEHFPHYHEHHTKTGCITRQYLIDQGIALAKQNIGPNAQQPGSSALQSAPNMHQSLPNDHRLVSNEPLSVLNKQQTIPNAHKIVPNVKQSVSFNKNVLMKNGLPENCISTETSPLPQNLGHFKSCRCDVCIDAEIERLKALKQSQPNCACVINTINKKSIQNGPKIANKTCRCETSALSTSPARKKPKKKWDCFNLSSSKESCVPCLEVSLINVANCEKENCTYPPEVRYALTKISKFQNYTTFELMKSTTKKPKVCPCNIEGVFVLKNKKK